MDVLIGIPLNIRRKKSQVTKVHHPHKATIVLLKYSSTKSYNFLIGVKINHGTVSNTGHAICIDAIHDLH